MDIQVMSREAARKYSYSVQQDCAIISISDMWAENNAFAKNSHIKGILRLNFDDVEVVSGDYQPITFNDAEAIVSFVDRLKDKIDLLVVHCNAGVSRSAGVAAALMAYYNGSDMPIFQNGKYCPNMRCYRSVMNAMQKNITDQEADIKLNANIEAWKQAQNF